MSVRTGCWPDAWSRLCAPTAPSSAARTSARRTPVGVKLLVLVTGVAGVPYGVATMRRHAGLEDVGLRLKARVAPAGRPCSVKAIASCRAGCRRLGSELGDDRVEAPVPRRARDRPWARTTCRPGRRSAATRAQPRGLGPPRARGWRVAGDVLAWAARERRQRSRRLAGDPRRTLVAAGHASAPVGGLRAARRSRTGRPPSPGGRWNVRLRGRCGGPRPRVAAANDVAIVDVGVRTRGRVGRVSTQNAVTSNAARAARGGEQQGEGQDPGAQRHGAESARSIVASPPAPGRFLRTRPRERRFSGRTGGDAPCPASSSALASTAAPAPPSIAGSGLWAAAARRPAGGAGAGARLRRRTAVPRTRARGGGSTAAPARARARARRRVDHRRQGR